MRLPPTFRPLPVLLALALVIIGIAAGNWQSGRAREKEALRQRYEQLRKEPPIMLSKQATAVAALEFRRVVARGEWRSEYGIYLDNKVLKGVVGYQVLMPLRLDGSNMHVLIDRGWIAAPRDRRQLPEVGTPSGVVEVMGEVRQPSRKFLELGAGSNAGKVWQNVTIERFREWSKLELQPFLLLQDSVADDGLMRQWERPDLGIDVHRGYALQWYSLAALTVVFFVILSLRKSLT